MTTNSKKVVWSLEERKFVESDQISDINRELYDARNERETREGRKGRNNRDREPFHEAIKLRDISLLREDQRNQRDCGDKIQEIEEMEETEDLDNLIDRLRDEESGRIFNSPADFSTLLRNGRNSTGSDTTFVAMLISGIVKDVEEVKEIEVVAVEDKVEAKLDSIFLPAASVILRALSALRFISSFLLVCIILSIRFLCLSLKFLLAFVMNIEWQLYSLRFLSELINPPF